MTKSSQESQLSHPLLSQTVCSALQIALIDLLESWGVYPASVTGHSSGEIAAAYASGALNMEDAMSIAYYRGVAASKLLTAQVQGGMMAIGMSPEEVEPHLATIKAGRAVIACINSPSSVTVSGDAHAIDELAESLKDNPAFSRRLAVDVAYHSHHMELVANDYLESIEHIIPRKPDNSTDNRISFFSSVTGTELQPEALGPPYWVSNLLGQVKFAESVKKLCFETNTRHTGIGISARRRVKRAGTAQKPSVDFILEIGPHSALSAPMKQILQADAKLKATDIEYGSILVRNKHAVSCALDTMKKLASLNYPLDFESINRPKETTNQRGPRLLVDLPPYPWNHSRSYWAEPRLSKMYRNREFPRTDLLGAPDNMACPFEPRWRNYLRISEIPWLKDHKIQSDIVFPAAGYICIAIEAAMQLATDIGEVAAFALRDISIRSALIIPENGAIEIMTSLRRLDEKKTNQSDRAYRFHVYSVSKDNRWTEHCTGVVGVERELGDADEVKISDLYGSAMLPASESASISMIEVGQLYERLRHVGLDYGPCFANLTSAHTTENGACFAEITLPDTAAAMPMQFEHPLLIHPCTLDSMFHAIFAALPDDASLERGPLIPVSIKSMRVSSSISSGADEVLSTRTHVRTDPKDKDTVVASIVAANRNDECDMYPKISVNGLRCKRLEIAPLSSKSSPSAPLVYGIEWQPDPDFLIGNHNSCRILEQYQGSVKQSLSREEYEDYTTCFIKELLIKFDQHDQSRNNSVVNKYRSSLAELLQRDNTQGMTKTAQIDEAKQWETPQSMTRILSAIGAQISSIFNGDEKSIQESRAELWNAHWEVLATDSTYTCAALYLALIGNKKPDISVLEICEGTGQPCTMFVQRLAEGIESQNQPPRCLRYTFTYRDNSELDEMKSRLGPWSQLIDFIKLSIERDTSEQELEKHLYDVIVAPHGLRSVHSTQRILENLRSMLKPSGYLLIADYFHPEENILDAIMISALYLWPADIFSSPCKNDERKSLVNALRDADFTTHNFAEASPTTSRAMLTVSRLRKDTEHVRKRFTIIPEKGYDETVVMSLQQDLENLGCTVKLADIANLHAKDEICVVLSDMQMHMLASIQGDIMEKVKDVFLHSAGVLWITRGGTVDPTCPEAGLASGFARTARSESGVGSIVTLDLGSSDPFANSQAAEIILGVIKTHFLRKDAIAEDTEYAERGSVVLIPRVIEQEDMYLDVTKASREAKHSQQSFRQKDCPVRLSGADTDHPQPYFTIGRETAEMPAGYVGIEVLAFGLNECDTHQASEVEKSSDTLGLECSGRVYALGQGVEGFSVGDRVVCLGVGAARTFYHNEASAFQKIDDGMSYELAAALPVAYSTAYYVVHYLARIRAHDTVLIQDAASWYGQAIIEVCHMRSAAIIATVESMAQKEALSNRFRIPPHRVLIDGEDDISKRILEITNGRKVDVAITFSATKSRSLQMIWKCIASFGRLIQLRTRDLENKTECNLYSVKNVFFSTFNIFELQKERTDITRHTFGKIMRFFREGRLRGPSSFTVQSVGEIEKAFGAFSSEDHVVITTEGNEIVKVSPLLITLEYPLTICRQYFRKRQITCSEETHRIFWSAALAESAAR